MEGIDIQSIVRQVIREERAKDGANGASPHQSEGLRRKEVSVSVQLRGRRGETRVEERGKPAEIRATLHRLADQIDYE
jgi:hypothetical protein